MKPRAANRNVYKNLLPYIIVSRKINTNAPKTSHSFFHLFHFMSFHFISFHFFPIWYLGVETAFHYQPTARLARFRERSIDSFGVWNGTRKKLKGRGGGPKKQLQLLKFKSEPTQPTSRGTTNAYINSYAYRSRHTCFETKLTLKRTSHIFQKHICKHVTQNKRTNWSMHTCSCFWILKLLLAQTWV